MSLKRSALFGISSIIFLWTACSFAQGEGNKADATSDPISAFLSNTLLAPAKLLSAEKKAKPEMTEDQKRMYEMKEVPLEVEKYAILLVRKDTDKVEYYWSDQQGAWFKPDTNIRKYLQEKYANKEKMEEKIKEKRILQSMQKKLDDMRSSTLGTKEETQPVQ